MATHPSGSAIINGTATCAEATSTTIDIAATLLTGGFDKPYAFGLATALASKGVRLDVIGSDEVDCPELRSTPNLNFLNLRGSKRRANLATKIFRVLLFYVRLARYAAIAEPKLFHILWNNKFEFFDRTLLMLYYKTLRKQVVFTAHNVNAGKRDSNDSLLNRLTLKLQYLLADHIFVHTEKMKGELAQEFGICEGAITVIPFGINNSVPNTDLTSAGAKRKLGIKDDEKAILFFGAIRPYKGLDCLVEAFCRLAALNPGYRLIIAGESRKGYETYLADILRRIDSDINRERVLLRIQYVPDEDTELYFKAADVLALPYTHIFQSGVLFLAYSFGLPVVATDVGSIREDMVEGVTGFLCRPCDSVDMARAFEQYFASDLFKTLDRRRSDIRDYASARHSWAIVSQKTRDVYVELLGDRK